MNNTEKTTYYRTEGRCFFNDASKYLKFDGLCSLATNFRHYDSDVITILFKLSTHLHAVNVILTMTFEMEEVSKR